MFYRLSLVQIGLLLSWGWSLVLASDQQADLIRRENELATMQLALHDQNADAMAILNQVQTGNVPALVKADLLQKAFQEKLDQHTLAQYDFFIHSSFTSINQWVAAIQPNQLSYFEQRQIKKALQALKQERQQYFAFKHYFQTAQDWKRVQAARGYFKKLQKLSIVLDKIAAPRLQLPSLEPQPLVRRSATQSLKKLGSFLPTAVRLGWELLRNQPLQNGKLAASLSAQAAFSSLKESDGIEFEIRGTENLPQYSAAAKNEIIIFAPTHRGRPIDQYLPASLPMNDLLVYAAVDQFTQALGLPTFLGGKILANILDRSHMVIAVDRGSGTALKETLQIFNTQGGFSALLFPQGIVHGGFLETSPPRQGFASALLKPLVEAGIQVRVIPITSIDSGQFLGSNSLGPEQLRQRVVIHPEISGQHLKQLLALDDGQALNRLIRAFWLETLKTDDQYLMGQLRTNAIQRKLRGQILDSAGLCAQILSR